MSKKWVSIYCFIFMMVTTVVWAKPDSAYIDNGNGTVTDIETKLMWQQGSAAPSLVFAIELSTIQNAIKQSGARWEAVVPDKTNPMRSGLLKEEEKSYPGHGLKEIHACYLGTAVC